MTILENEKTYTSVKTQLFQSYCTNLYCTELWQCYNASSSKALSAAHNVLRNVISVPGKHSISAF